MVCRSRNGRDVFLKTREKKVFKIILQSTGRLRITSEEFKNTLQSNGVFLEGVREVGSTRFTTTFDGRGDYRPSDHELKKLEEKLGL